MDSDDTELLVIGAGPAGYTAAIRGAQHELDVVLVERETVGEIEAGYACADLIDEQTATRDSLAEQ